MDRPPLTLHPLRIAAVLLGLYGAAAALWGLSTVIGSFVTSRDPTRPHLASFIELVVGGVTFLVGGVVVALAAVTARGGRLGRVAALAGALAVAGPVLAWLTFLPVLVAASLLVAGVAVLAALLPARTR